MVKRRRRKLAELGGADVQRWLAGMPDRYFAAEPPANVARHVRLSRARGDRPAALAVTHQVKQGFSELVVAAADMPGLLARVTGVLLANRMDIVGARIHSRSAVDPGDRGEALDVFLVRDRYGRAIPGGDPRWKRVEQDLTAVVGGTETVEQLILARRETSTLPGRITPEVPTEVEIDNDVSNDFTVVDVYTQDRVGVLYAITRTLTELGLDIGLSKVATEANRVADVFYVRDRETGSKWTDASRLAALDKALRAALAAVPA
jgi:[protein-PII] uridylyltransferase